MYFTAMTEIKTFSETIENLAADLEITIMEAVIHYCEKNEIEVETASKLLNKKLRDMIELEASDLNMMKEKISHLPI